LTATFKSHRAWLDRMASGLVGMSLAPPHRLAGDALQMAALATWSWTRLLEGLLYPAGRALAEIDRETTLSSVLSLVGRDPAGRARELADRMVAAMRYAHLVRTLGAELFGSARWPEEEVLGEDEYYRLCYLPSLAPGGPVRPALFHLGGVLPYGDRLFRLLPEANLLDRFRERGMAVYALELKGDARSLDFAGLTLARVFTSIDRHSAMAFAHAGGRRLILEGYCGLASQALAFVAARPREADERFSVLASFVGPVDGTRCDLLAEPLRLVPDEILTASWALAEWTEGTVSGDDLRLTQDLALRALFLKTPLGQFLAGFQRPDLARVERVADLTAQQRKILAGAFWVSPENGRRYPVPVDLARFSGVLFKEGVGPDGTIPFPVEGRPLSLATVARETRMHLVGFYGGKDVLVPDRTAAPLKALLGDRYTHVVHKNAGHISYILSPRLWRPGPEALDPNPVDLLLAIAETHNKNRSTAGPRSPSGARPRVSKSERHPISPSAGRRHAAPHHGPRPRRQGHKKRES
jgi:hypothetical protein